MEILITAIFCCLAFKVLGLAFQVAWSAAKAAASALFVIAVPMLVLGLIFAGGALLLIPLALIGAAFGLLRKCV